jgi:hypothetical protein
LAVVFTAAVFAQTPAGTGALNAGPAYTSKDGQGEPQFPRIELLVRLVDEKGAPQAFEPGDLSLYSGNIFLGQGSGVRSFADTGYGVRSILALDLSGSMKGAPLDAVRSSIAKFVNQARDQDQVEVISFADDSRVEVPFGADKSTLAARLKSVNSRGTKTRLYDGILDALAQLDAASPARRQLTVISDGFDEGSRHSIDDVIRQALQEKVSIDSIGLTRSHPEHLQSLTRISQATGGNFVRAATPDQLDGLIEQGIQAMRAAPVVAFTLSNLDSDGKTHGFELRWQPQHLTASFDVPVPLIVHPWAVWGWVLGGCFVAGVVLLIVARRQSRSAKPVPDSHASAAPVPQQTPNPPVVYRSGSTVVEEPPTEPAPPDRAYAETVVEDANPMRAKTRMVALFGAEGGPLLEVTTGPLAGKSYPLSGDFRIGALDGNDLVIPDDPTLSGFHARILLADQVLTIEDTRSKNGTYVNGARLEPGRKLLRPGDGIRMGRSTFRVRTG